MSLFESTPFPIESPVLLLFVFNVDCKSSYITTSNVSMQQRMAGKMRTSIYFPRKLINCLQYFIHNIKYRCSLSINIVTVHLGLTVMPPTPPVRVLYTVEGQYFMGRTTKTTITSIEIIKTQNVDD